MSEGGNCYKSINEYPVPQALEIARDLSKEHGIELYVDTGRVEWDASWGELVDAFVERR